MEEAFVRLFNLIDYRLSAYVGAAENGYLKAQALQNVDGMLEIFKIMNQSRYRRCALIRASGPVNEKRFKCNRSSLRKIV